MPNTLNAADALYDVLVSGLVVSGNAYIVLAKNITSGDAITSFNVSGFTDFIILNNVRGDGMGITGGTFVEIADYVEATIFKHETYTNTTNVYSGVVRMVDDLKITVASGSFTNPPRPVLVTENWTVPHEKATRASLTYRFRYLL